jgi:hypothetical protein
MSATLVAENCAPVTAAGDELLWYAKTGNVWQPFIGNANAEGKLLLAIKGNCAPADVTADGRYVLLTVAVGWEADLSASSPGRGSDNEIALYDRQTGKLSTLLKGATATNRGVIWPRFTPDASTVIWSQMMKTAKEVPPTGQWSLRAADVDLEAGTLSSERAWEDTKPAFYECYGVIPGTELVVFASDTRATSTQAFRAQQLWTLPLSLTGAPTRISPPIAQTDGRPPADCFHEFAYFAPEDPLTLYTAIGAGTDGGDDLYAYNLPSGGPVGLLGQPTRVSYFGGEWKDGRFRQVEGYPPPAYTAISTMAWVDGAWLATVAPDLLSTTVAAWRIAP